MTDREPPIDVHRLGPPPRRIEVEARQVRELVAEQHPRWADLVVEPMDPGGWDNRTFRLGRRLVVRLPSAGEYALAVEKEHRWLPRLAPLLPLPIPSIAGRGRPGAGYPYPWSVHHWLDGEPVTPGGIRDERRFARDLAAFLTALRRVDPEDGPAPGVHNWYRGGSLRTFDETVRSALTTLADLVDVALVREVWSAALDAPWSGRPQWFHGDVAAGNLLLTDGELSAVIDFGTCGVGDPSCDLAAAWTLLGPDARPLFRDHLAVDPASWTRGRGWALWKALASVAGTRDAPDEAGVRARLVLDEICADHLAGGR